MERIAGQDHDSKELAEIVLSCITCANRRLTTSELQCALAVEVGDQELDEENLPQVRDMVSVCAGLVTIDDESNVIRLVHYTTQEYFKRRQDRWFPNAEIGIAKTCITYLLFNVFESGFCLTDEDFEKRLLLNPLYDYAARNWGHHARMALDEEVTKLVLVFLQSVPKISASIQAGMLSKDSVGYSQKVPQQITGLHLAAYFGLPDVILTLITHGHSPNVTDSYHQTPLLLAAVNGYKSAVSVLIATDGIDINCEDKHGRTPLSFAAEGGHDGVVNQLLTQEDVDLNSKDEYDQAPLSWAAWKGHTAVVDLLSTKDCANPNVEHTLYGAVHLSIAARKGNEEAVKLFFTRLHPNSIDKYGQTLLAVAAACGQEAILKLMIAVDGIHLDLKDVHGKTALMYAAENGHEAIVKLLLDVENVDHSAKDKNGQTALFWALENKHESIVKLLLRRVLDANPKINSGQTLLLFSTAETKIVELWFKEGYQASSEAQSGRTLLSYAAECGYDRVVNLLYSNGYQVNSEGKDSRTALSYAAEKGHESVIKFLLENGAILELKGNEGWTPLFFAAQNWHEAVFKLLLESGAEHRTLLSYAAQNGHEAVVECLLESGAELELKDSDGWTPVMFAAASGQEAVVKLLLTRDETDVDAKDIKGRTAFWHAVQGGHSSAAQQLFNKGADIKALLGYEYEILTPTLTGFRVKGWVYIRGAKMLCLDERLLRTHKSSYKG
jgi:ankyrin repeat protein